ncbi:unnamed protein product, partial [marine sediment metagenome]
MRNNKRICQMLFSILFCGTLLLPASLVHAVTLEVYYPGFPGDFGVDNWSDSGAPGSFFDLTAAATANIDITSFSAFSFAAGSGSPGDPYTIQVWTKSGSYVGSEEVAGDWTLLQSFSGTDDDDLTMETLTLSTPLSLPAGNTIGVAIFATVGGFQWYDVCGGSDNYTEGDLELNISSVRGTDDAFNDSDTCKSFAGRVTFDVSATGTSGPPGTPGTPATPVPAMPLWLLGLMGGLLSLLAVRKLR